MKTNTYGNLFPLMTLRFWWFFVSWYLYVKTFVYSEIFSTSPLFLYKLCLCYSIFYSPRFLLAIQIPLLNLLSCRAPHGGVRQRSGTGLETPLLGWALPLKNLNHTSLGVDVPLFSTRVKITFSFCFISGHALFSSNPPKTLISHKPINTLDYIFLLWVTHNLYYRLCRDLSIPALCQDWVTVDLTV